MPIIEVDRVTEESQQMQPCRNGFGRRRLFGQPMEKHAPFRTGLYTPPLSIGWGGIEISSCTVREGETLGAKGRDEAGNSKYLAVQEIQRRYRAEIQQ